jgi:hypothetical protein
MRNIVFATIMSSAVIAGIATGVGVAMSGVSAAQIEAAAADATTRLSEPQITIAAAAMVVPTDQVE